MIPANKQPGEIPQGRARCRRAIPDTPDRYPEQFSYNETGEMLHVGDGEFGPVSKAVWDFSVSDLQVVHSWLNFRKKDGAGRSSSPLDDIRPARWTAAMSQELLELLWVLEATFQILSELEETLTAIVSGPTFRANELPRPTEDERQARGDDDAQDGQQELMG